MQDQVGDAGRSRIGGRSRTAAAFCALLASGLLAACGSTTHGTTSPNPTSGSAQSTGSKAATSGAPILIGLANNEGQAISIPEYRYGAEAAVKYLNANGGVNGHALQLVECVDDGSPEGAVNCANKFVASHAVAYVAGIDVGADSALPIIDGAGIPYVSEFAWGPTTMTDTNSFLFGAGLLPFYIAPIQELKALGVTKAAYFFDNIPTGSAFLPAAQNLSRAAGITLVPVPLNASNPDWTSAVATAQAGHVNGMWGIMQEGDCTNMVRAARSAGFTGPIGAGSCSNYISTLGAQAANTLGDWPYYFPSVAADAPTTAQAQLKTYQAAMVADGHAGAVQGFAGASFATMVELSEVMKAISGPVTATGLKTALQHADVPGFTGPNINCAARAIPSEPASCNAETLQYKVVASGSGAKQTLLTPNFVNSASIG